MLAQFSISPRGTEVSISDKVARVIDYVDKSGLDYRLTDMGTIIDGTLSDIFNLVKRCHEIMAEDAERVITTLKIDDYRTKEVHLGDGVRSIEAKLGRAVKK